MLCSHKLAQLRRRAKPDAWVSTKVGPALCGRTGGDGVNPAQLGCTILDNGHWRLVGLNRATDWGLADARAWVPTPGGTVSYCRLVGDDINGHRVSCTRLDAETRTWGPDVISGRTDWTLPDTF